MVQLLEQQQQKAPKSWIVDRLVNRMKGINELQCCPNRGMKVSIATRDRKQRDKQE